MSGFPSIDEVNNMLDDIAAEIPEEIFRKLNGGIVLLPESKIHPESMERRKLYIMGEYTRNVAGRHIAIYYGSFKDVYRRLSREVLYEKLRETLFHEFVHHLESLAGERDLEIEDHYNMEKYRKMD